jgi:hypothetical protein
VNPAGKAQPGQEKAYEVISNIFSINHFTARTIVKVMIFAIIIQGIRNFIIFRLFYNPIDNKMKKWMIGSLVLIVMMILAAGVYAQTTDKQKKHSKTECTFVDKNKDGKCDICGSTAGACKNDAKTTTTADKDCSKCPSAAGCAATNGEVVPAREGTGNVPPCCAGKK